MTPTSRAIARRSSARAAFTLIELMVVIAIIGVLISIILLVSSQLMGQQKQRLTQTVMESVLVAIDEFAAKNPLKSTYDREGSAALGPYPPLHADFPDDNYDDDEVADIVERRPPDRRGDELLKQRLARDFFDDPDLNDDDQLYVLEEDDDNLDNRLLYAYLAAFAPDALAQISDRYKQPLDADGRTGEEFFNLGGEDDQLARTPILGLVDGWGVPLDYLLYVKLELVFDPATGDGKWVVADRKPVLRSRGVDQELVDAGGDSPETWIWSEPLPRPFADVDEDGQIQDASNSESGGWVRLRAFGEDYGWLPEYDPQ